MKWTPIENKEQWPKEPRLILIMRDSYMGEKECNQGNSCMMDVYIKSKYTHFAVIPSLAESEEREKKKNEMLAKLSRLHDKRWSLEGQDSDYLVDLYFELEELLNQL